MDVGEQSHEGVPEGIAVAQPGELQADNGAVVVPVQVGDGVEEVVLSYDEAFMGGDTTYIIQFVDDGTNPNLANTIASTIVSTAASGTTVVQSDIGPVIGVPEHQQTVQESSHKSPAALATVVEAPAPSLEALEAPAVTTPKARDPQPQAKVKLSKALNLQSAEAANTAKHVEKTRSKTETKSVATVKDSSNSDKLSSPESESSKRANRRSIKKPARFADIDTSSKKKQKEPKYLKIPSVSKKSLGIQDLCIEVEIEEKLFVSALERCDCDTEGFCKYVFWVSRNPVKTDVEFAQSEDEHPPEAQEPEKPEIIAEEVKPDTDIEPPDKIDESPATDQSLLKRKRGRPRKSLNVNEANKNEAKKSKLDGSHDENQPVKSIKKLSVEKAVKSSEDHDEDNTEALPTDIDETNDGADHMTELDDIVKSEGILQTDGTLVESQESVETVDEDLPKSKKKKQAPKKKQATTKKKKKEPKVKEEAEPGSGDADPAVEQEEKPKRKYVKRNVYQRDDQNYTVKKSETGVKIFVCDICSKECVSAANMMDHLCVHTNIRPVPCGQCALAFKSEKALKRHVVRHTEKKFICDSCGALFFSASDLKSHASVHTNKREFICGTCGKGFNHSTTLSRHKQLHKEQRSTHVCHICGAMFKRKDHVQRHVINIHGGKEVVKNESSSNKKWFRNKHMNSKADSEKQTKKSLRQQGSKAIPAGSEIIKQSSSQTDNQELEAGEYWTIYDTNQGHVHFYKPSLKSESFFEPQNKYTDISKSNFSVYIDNTSTGATENSGARVGAGLTDQGLHYATQAAAPQELMQQQMTGACTPQGDTGQYIVIHGDRNNTESVAGNWL